MRKAFVTGGSGFVGRNLIAALCERGVEVRALARSAEAAAKVKEGGAEVVHGDVESPDALKTGIRDCDVVFHAAAVVKLWGKPEEFHRVNVQGTKNVVQAAKANGVPRLVHVSTEALLAGGPPIVNADETWPYPKRPVGLYALTKGIAERETLKASGNDLCTVAVRPPFIWGQGDTSVLPQLVRAVKRNQWMWFDGGRYPHSTCHIANMVEGALLAAEKGRCGEVYFLTDGEPMEFRKFVTSMLATQGIKPGDASMPLWLAGPIARVLETIWNALRLKDTPPLPRSVLFLMGQEVTVSDKKARQELGYQGKMSFEEGLKQMTAGGSHA